MIVFGTGFAISDVSALLDMSSSIVTLNNYFF